MRRMRRRGKKDGNRPDRHHPMVRRLCDFRE
jgi:hypothetical protein